MISVRSLDKEHMISENGSEGARDIYKNEQPRNPATREAYEAIPTLIANALSLVPHDVVIHATDAILEFLKGNSAANHDKRRAIGHLLGISISSVELSELVSLDTKITDY